MSFGAYRVAIVFMFSPLLYWSTISGHWLPCNIPSGFEPLQPSTGAFRIIAHLQGYFMSLQFHHLAIHSSSVLSSLAKSVRQLIFLVAMLCSMNLHAFQNIALLQSLLLRWIHLFEIRWQCGEWDFISMGNLHILLPFLSASLMIWFSFCYLVHVFVFSLMISALRGMKNSECNNMIDVVALLDLQNMCCLCLDFCGSQ
jgi:hypothetical protein